ncbi:MAG: hypothetical protein AAF907_04610 [Planctomycetota bacterium]
MTYEQEVIAFAATRLAVLIGAGLLLAAASRRWQDDRAVAGCLIAAGLLLILGYSGETPLPADGWGGAVYAEPLYRRVNETGFGWAFGWALWAALPASAACGLTAVFLRREARSEKPSAEESP